MSGAEFKFLSTVKGLIPSCGTSGVRHSCKHIWRCWLAGNQTEVINFFASLASPTNTGFGTAQWGGELGR